MLCDGIDKSYCDSSAGLADGWLTAPVSVKAAVLTSVWNILVGRVERKQKQQQQQYRVCVTALQDHADERNQQQPTAAAATI